MKKMITMALAVIMVVSPLMPSALAVENVRREQEKEIFEGGRSSRRPPRRDYDRHRRDRRYYRRSHSGEWVAAGILGAAIIGGAIASSKSSKSTPTYVYEQPPTVVYQESPTVVYPGTTSYVYPSTTVVQPYGSGNVVVDPNVYTYDENGNLVPYYQ